MKLILHKCVRGVLYASFFFVKIASCDEDSGLVWLTGVVNSALG